MTINYYFYLSIYLPFPLHCWQCGCVVSTVRSPAGLCVKMPRNFNSLSVVPPSPLLLQAVTGGVDRTVSLSVKLVRSTAYICSTACLPCLSCPACPLYLSCPTLLLQLPNPSHLPPPTFPTATLLSSLKKKKMPLSDPLAATVFTHLGPSGWEKCRRLLNREAFSPLYA